VYPELGNYTATVTATNQVSSLSATTAVTISEEAISGLTLVAASPTTLGDITLVTATLTAGTNAGYELNFGDTTAIQRGTPIRILAYSTITRRSGVHATITAVIPGEAGDKRLLSRTT
jgi:hypothetical protein